MAKAKGINGAIANGAKSLAPTEEIAYKLAQSTQNLLNQCEAWIQRYVILSPEQRAAITLWVLHTWVIDASDITPYLHVTAPEPACGKSLLLDTLEPLVRKPWKTSGVTTSVLYRKIHGESPTLLLDEVDTMFGGKPDFSQTLRGILNAGFKRGGTYSVSVVNPNKAIGTAELNCFCPKVIAGIGNLPHTVESRAVTIAMRRKTPTEKVERFRVRDVDEASKPIYAALANWGRSAMPLLKDARPVLLDELSDRQQDVSEPLLAIAELAGGEWPEKARRSLLTLFAGSAAKQSGVSVGVALLGAIRAVFAQRDRLPSAELARELQAMEGEPWADRHFDAHQLASRLRNYGIHPHKIRFGNNVVLNGYLRSDFVPAWRQYCSGTSGTNVTTITEPALAEVQ